MRILMSILCIKYENNYAVFVVIYAYILYSFKLYFNYKYAVFPPELYTLIIIVFASN